MRATEETLVRLRREFDGAFAEPVSSGGDDHEMLLRITVSDAPYAVRLREIEGLFADRAIVAAPSPLADLLGLTSIRGRLLPVYSLGMILGVSSSRTPRWFVVAEGVAAAFAFDTMSGHVRADPAELLVSETGEGALCPHTLRLPGERLGVISIPAAVKRIESRVAARRSGLGA